MAELIKKSETKNLGKSETKNLAAEEKSSSASARLALKKLNIRIM